jgi:D-beta-D-heptose 7-phosphate kinase/D-beta-D-heptose 1-phosphate adenosyltransferase
MLKFVQKSTIKTIITEKFPQAKIAVVGDLMLDQYLWGKASRISPEAPVPIVRIDRKNHCLGGAGNVANNLAVLGCQTQLIGVVGNDNDADILRNEMLRSKINTDHLVIDFERPTTIKTRVISGSQQLIRLDNESSGFVSSQIEKKLLDLSLAQLEFVDLVVLSDYGKGVLTDYFLQTFIAVARQKKIPVLIDPKRRDYTAYSGATAITPNRAEAELALQRVLLSDQDFEVAGEELRQKFSFDVVLITRSEKGMTLSLPDNRYHFPTQAREVFDISGAGDAVIAVLASGLSVGLSWPAAVELANLGAGIAVQKVGTAPIYREELLQVLEQEGISNANSKVLQLPDLIQQVATWRSQGKKIVFTNGCFDLLHVGHVVYLEKARALGDILIVGLNSDDSVRNLKGPTRPLIIEGDRARVLASLSSVDAVTLFEQETPIDLIKIIKPDVIAKGADYKEKEVVGADFVRSYKGEVCLIPLVQNKSTTRIVTKVTGSIP